MALKEIAAWLGLAKKPEEKNKLPGGEVWGDLRGDYYWRILRTLPDGTFEQGLKYPQGPSKIKLTNVTSLFEAAQVHCPFPILIIQNNSTYEVDSVPENNWFYAAFKGFQVLASKLKAESKNCDKFLSVGTGPGIDGIGAHYILDPLILHVNDISDSAVDTAERNIRNNIRPGHCNYAFFPSDLFKSVYDWNKYDVIYGNLPNIPASQLQIEDSMDAATYVQDQSIKGAPEKFDRYLLAHQWHFLRQAHNFLEDDGSVVLALGGRVPFELIEELFRETGYKMEGLYSLVKMQTQPEAVVAGYAQAEAENRVEFIFYDLEDLMKNPLCQMDLSGNAQSLDYKKFTEYAVSAQEALALSREGKAVGHLVLILRGVKGEGG